MDNLTNFELFAASCSIFSVVVIILGWTKNRFSQFKNKQRESDESINKEIENYKNAGSNLTGRTDLGFLLQIELVIMNERTAEYRLYSIINLLLASMIMSFLWTKMQSVGSYDSWFVIGCLAFFLVSSFSGGLYIILAWKQQKQSSSYAQRIKSVWSESIAKRIKDA